MTADETYYDVAVPVPLRRTFAYRAPKDGVELLPGTRVAVTFARRKVAGFVLGRTERPEGVSRILSIAGPIEPEPIFPQELLDFLIEAARYYMHPVGEVLRAAAPMLSRERIKELRAQGFLGPSEKLPGGEISLKKVWWATRSALSVEGIRLGKAQRIALTMIEKRAELPVPELRDQVKGALRVVRGLAEKGLVDLDERDEAVDRFLGPPVEPETPPNLTTEQERATAEILSALRTGDPRTFLLQGVTGSGKTEVYLRAIQEAEQRGLGALLLVPEIALTPQLVARFRARLGDAIAVLHSGLSARERNDAWRALRSGELKLAIGARSALFAPVDRLGILVVDEEHDPSFKQEDGFRYQARDMAMLRAHRASAICILGSATPSIESRHLAETGRVSRLLMPSRATVGTLPEVEIVDLKRHKSGPQNNRHISGPLHYQLRECLDKGEQAILFLNRRGFSPSLRCESCGALQQCPSCSVALTEHKGARVLRCHYCDYRRSATTPCSECSHEYLFPIGLGTEQLEETLAEMFPDAVVARLDRDTASGRGVETVLGRLRRGEVDILVGTQMVTKGHDIPMVTVVGVLLADQSLAFPDFRAHERTFQLLCQVAGRAGRAERKGRVIFQTFEPEHPAVTLAARHDYEAFYRDELENRRELGYVPFAHLAAVRVSAGDEQQAKAVAQMLGKTARSTVAAERGDVEVLGPAASPLSRLRGRYRFQLLLRSGSRGPLRSVARALRERIEEGIGPARASLDIDPVSML